MASILTFLATFDEECCPLCYVQFTDNPAIMICTAQHVVCRTCKYKLEKEYRMCPQCKQPFRDQEYRTQYKVKRRLNQSKKEMEDLQKQKDFCLPPFRYQFQHKNQEEIALLRKMTIINSVFCFYMKRYKKAKQMLYSAFNGEYHEMELGDISDGNTQDFDPIIKTVLKLNGFKLLNKLTEIYEIQEKSSKDKRSKKPWSCQLFPTPKYNPKISDVVSSLQFDQKYFQYCSNQYKKDPKNPTLIYDMITLYSSRPRQHKRLPNHYSFLQKHISHHQRHIQIFATIGLIIYMSLEKKHYRAMNELDIALRVQDFVQAINRCKNKFLIQNLKEAISSSLRKTQRQMLVEALAVSLREVPRVVGIEEMLFLAERHGWAFWDQMVQTYYCEDPQLQLKIAASYLKRANGRPKALRMYNDVLMDQKANKMDVVGLIKKSFTQEEEADYLQKEGCYRGELYDSRILAEWKNIKQMLKKTKQDTY